MLAWLTDFTGLTELTGFAVDLFNRVYIVNKVDRVDTVDTVDRVDKVERVDRVDRVDRVCS